MPVTQKLNVWKQDGSFCRNPAFYIDNIVLASGVAETWTVPSGCKRVFIRSNADIYYRIDNAAAVPSGDVSGGAGSALLTDDMDVSDVSSISIVSASACVVSFECYA